MEGGQIMISTGKLVFISYSSREKDIADGVVNKLQSAGIQSWIAPRDIPIGSDYTTEIPAGIAGCPFYLVLLSNNSLSSDYVKKEMVCAFDLKKYVLPLLLESGIPVERIAFLLNNVQYRPFYENQDAVMEEVISVIRSRQGRQQETVPASATAFRNRIGYSGMASFPSIGNTNPQASSVSSLSDDDRYYEGMAYMAMGLYKDAVSTLKTAADAGHPLAQYELANCCRTGCGAEKNIGEANRYYRMAAEQMHRESRFRLGFHYMCGQGFRQDFEQAEKWFALAAAQGHEEAERILNTIRKAL